MSHSTEKLNKVHVDQKKLGFRNKKLICKSNLYNVLGVKATLQWVEMAQRDGILNTAEGLDLEGETPVNYNKDRGKNRLQCK